MTVRIITPPAAVLTLAEAKAHLRDDSGDEDGLIQFYIDSAFSHLCGENGISGRSIGEQTIEYIGRPCYGVISLPLPPYRSLVSAFYYNTSGEEIELQVEDFEVRAAAFGGVDLYLPTWPSASTRPDAYRIRYTAGMAPTDKAIEPIKLVMQLLVAHWFKNREATGRIADTSAIPFSIASLLSPIHIWSV